MRQEFLGRTAEEYRDSAHYSRKLRDGLRNLADTARDMAQSGSHGLVEQFGQMGRRRFHMADVPANGDAEVDADDASQNGAVPEPFDVGAGNRPAVDEARALAVIALPSFPRVVKSSGQRSTVLRSLTGGEAGERVQLHS